MGIKAIFSLSALRKRAEQIIEEEHRKMLRILSRAGEIAVNEAKLQGNYENHTHNLRNSIGYGVYYNGVPMGAQFGVNTERSRAVAEQAVQGTRGYALVVVAGMQYALYVESKGYDVLTRAEQLSERIVPYLLNQLKQ